MEMYLRKAKLPPVGILREESCVDNEETIVLTEKCQKMLRRCFDRFDEDNDDMFSFQELSNYFAFTGEDDFTLENFNALAKVLNDSEEKNISTTQNKLSFADFMNIYLLAYRDYGTQQGDKNLWNDLKKFGFEQELINYSETKTNATEIIDLCDKIDESPNESVEEFMNHDLLVAKASSAKQPTHSFFGSFGRKRAAPASSGSESNEANDIESNKCFRPFRPNSWFPDFPVIVGSRNLFKLESFSPPKQRQRKPQHIELLKSKVLGNLSIFIKDSSDALLEPKTRIVVSPSNLEENRLWTEICRPNNLNELRKISFYSEFHEFLMEILNVDLKSLDEDLNQSRLTEASGSEYACPTTTLSASTGLCGSNSCFLVGSGCAFKTSSIFSFVDVIKKKKGVEFSVLELNAGEVLSSKKVAQISQALKSYTIQKNAAHQLSYERSIVLVDEIDVIFETDNEGTLLNSLLDLLANSLTVVVFTCRSISHRVQRLIDTKFNKARIIQCENRASDHAFTDISKSLEALGISLECFEKLNNDKHGLDWRKSVNDLQFYENDIEKNALNLQNQMIVNQCSGALLEDESSCKLNNSPKTFIKCWSGLNDQIKLAPYKVSSSFQTCALGFDTTNPFLLVTGKVLSSLDIVALKENIQVCLMIAAQEIQAVSVELNPVSESEASEWTDFQLKAKFPLRRCKQLEAVVNELNESEDDFESEFEFTFKPKALPKKSSKHKVFNYQVPQKYLQCCISSKKFDTISVFLQINPKLLNFIVPTEVSELNMNKQRDGKCIELMNDDRIKQFNDLELISALSHAFLRHGSTEKLSHFILPGMLAENLSFLSSNDLEETLEIKRHLSDKILYESGIYPLQVQTSQRADVLSSLHQIYKLEKHRQTLGETTGRRRTRNGRFHHYFDKCGYPSLSSYFDG